MKVILPHKIASQKVESLKEILPDVDAMMKMINEQNFTNGQKGYALHHSQVSKKPKNFFVIHPLCRHHFEGNHLIVNPRIVDRKDARETSLECCLSYPFRPAKKTNRWYRILLQCEVEDEYGGLKGVMLDLVGLGAYITQHEIDHAHGQFIYDK